MSLSRIFRKFFFQKIENFITRTTIKMNGKSNKNDFPALGQSNSQTQTTFNLPKSQKELFQPYFGYF